MPPLDDPPPGWPLLGVSQRLPPQNIEAEQALLGALLSNSKTFERCGDLRAEMFADPVHQQIFAAIARRVAAGGVATLISVKDELEQTGALVDVGGMVYLSQLVGATIGIIAASEYAKVIRETWALRQAIEIGTDLVNLCFMAAGASPAKLVGDAAALLDQLAASHVADRSVTLDKAMDQALAAMERANSGATAGISSGFGCIDRRLGGLEPGLVYVIAGRPGMGKSALGHQIAMRVARAGTGVLELSLEMSAAQLGRRALATASGVSIGKLKAGGLDMLQAEAVVCARQELGGLPLTIDDAADQTPAMIARKVRAARRKHGLGLVLIDHLNLMRAEEADARHGGTWATERASATVLQMAKDAECPVILLAQLNRGVEGRDDKRPGLSDLRQAGAIEQDAYAVGFVYRPEYYLSGEPERKAADTDAKYADRVANWQHDRERLRGVAELIWAKARDGETGTDRLTFTAPTATFGEPT